MKETIILLCNSCPFGGEPFLLNELKWVPEDKQVLLFPIFADTSKPSALTETNRVQVLGEKAKPSLWNHVLAALNAPFTILSKGELPEILRKKRPIRNALKAIKFAYVSECRAYAIKSWINRNCAQKELVFYSYWLYETAYVAAKLHEWFPNSRFVSRCHGFDLYEHRHPNGYLPFRKYLMEQADAICPVGEDGKRYLNYLYKNRWTDKIRLYRLGTEDFGSSNRNAENIPLLISCSNMQKVKRIDRIIEALSKYQYSLKWVHFGSGDLMEELRKKAEQLPKNICWEFRGNVSNEKIMEFYKKHDVSVFLNVSESEGVPVSIMEALSFGIPVIATDVGGTKELVMNGENGLLLPKDFQPQELVSGIESIINMNALKLEIMHRRAREIWQEKWSAETNFGLFYREVIDVEAR